MKKLVILMIALLLTGCGATVNVDAQEEAPDYGPGWTRITEGLWEQIPDYEDGKNHFVRRSGSLLVNPETGDLFLLVSPKYGIWHSADDGQSWARSDDGEASGRSWGGDGCQYDPKDPSRMMFFTIKGAGAPQQPAMSLDGGKTWKHMPVPNPSIDGWTSGQVDWSQENPQTIYAKEHHSERLWITRDGGENWNRNMPQQGAYKIGMIGDDVLLAQPKGTTELHVNTTGNPMDWKKVRDDAELQTRSPSVYGDHAYWPLPNRLLATMDRGATWKELPPIVQDPPEGDKLRTWGPVFGESEDHMLAAVQGHGFYRSDDRGQSWTKLVDWPQDLLEFDNPRQAFSIGWCPDKRLVYCAFLGGDAYRAQWQEKD